MKLHCREAPVWTFSYNMDKSESFCDVTSGLLAGHWKVLFRPKSPKWPTLTPRSSATVRRTKQFSGPQLTGSWTTTCSKHLSAVHPLTCSLLCVWCLFYPLRVWGFCANDHWLESFRKFLSKICVLTAIHVSKIGGCEVAEKSSRILLTKKLRRHSFRPHLTDRAQKFVNVVGPWPVHAYWLWSRSAAICRTYSGKSPKSEYNYRLSA